MGRNEHVLHWLNNMLTSKVTRTYIRRNPHDVNTTPSQGKPLGQSNQIKRHTKSSAWPFYCPPLPPLSQVHVLVFNASLSPKRHPSLSPHFDLPDQNQAGHTVSVPWTLRTFSGTLQSVYENAIGWDWQAASRNRLIM